MRSFAGLLAYLAGVSAAIFSIGIVGLMALQSPTERTPFIASHKEHLAKPVKQPIDGEKAINQIQKHKKVHISRKQRHQAPFKGAGHNAYGYAEEHRIDPKHFFFGR